MQKRKEVAEFDIEGEKLDVIGPQRDPTQFVRDIANRCKVQKGHHVDDLIEKDNQTYVMRWDRFCPHFKYALTKEKKIINPESKSINQDDYREQKKIKNFKLNNLIHDEFNYDID